MTRVITVRKQQRPVLEANPRFVYVGRRVNFTPWTERSPWCNPFWGAGALDRYHEMMVRVLANDLGLLERIRAELADKDLGCWCGVWSPGQPRIACHAVTLARLANGEDMP